jgi:hypothetical protein
MVAMIFDQKSGLQSTIGVRERAADDSVQKCFVRRWCLIKS